MDTKVRNNEIIFTSEHGPGGPSTTKIGFVRTLRLPNDGRRYNLPPGMGSFQCLAISDLRKYDVGEEMRVRGGVAIPMWKNEALYIRFDGDLAAVKVAAGKICVVSGKPWTSGLVQTPQNFVEAPKQKWIDGYAVADGHVKQFVAWTLGEGVTVEEQVSGKAEWGGIQIQLFHPTADRLRRDHVAKGPIAMGADFNLRSYSSGIGTKSASPSLLGSRFRRMGLGVGGSMEQKIYKGSGIEDYDQTDYGRVFVHIVDATAWKDLTGYEPHAPLTRTDYNKYGVPWFQVNDGGAEAVSANGALDGVVSVDAKGKKPFGVCHTGPFANGPLDGKW